MTMNNTPQSLHSRMTRTMGCYQDLKICYNYNIFNSFNVESNIYKVVVGIQTHANTILISEHLCNTVCTPTLAHHFNHVAALGECTPQNICKHPPRNSCSKESSMSQSLTTDCCIIVRWKLWLGISFLIQGIPDIGWGNQLQRPSGLLTIVLL